MSLLQVHSGKSADFSDGLLTYTAVMKTRTRIRKHRPASLSHWHFAQAFLVDPSRLKRVGVVGFDCPGHCWHLPLVLGTGDMVTGGRSEGTAHGSVGAGEQLIRENVTTLEQIILLSNSLFWHAMLKWPYGGFLFFMWSSNTCFQGTANSSKPWLMSHLTSCSPEEGVTGLFLFFYCVWGSGGESDLK